MSMPDKTQVLNVLKPHFPILIGCLRSAWSSWLDSEYLGRWNKRTRANFIWEETRHEAIMRLQGLPGVELETSILDIIIVARQGASVLWKSSVLHSDARVIPMHLQAEDTEELAPRRKATVRSVVGKESEAKLGDA